MQHMNRSTLLRGLALLVIASLLVLVLAVAAARSRLGVEGWDSYTGPPQGSSQADLGAARHFLGSAPDEERYRLLFEYFAKGAIQHANGSRVQYPGFGSTRGYAVSGLEGFARVAPLLAAWVGSGRGRQLEVRPGERPVDLVAFLIDALLAGTDPASPDYWGDLAANDQRIVETADIVRMLWLTREQIWDRLGKEDRQRVVRWLSQVDRAPVLRENNWLLFPVAVRAFLKGVGERANPDYRGYWKFKSGSYRESGWFTDGPGKAVDFYNAWGISYELFWIHQMDPELDPAFVREALLASGKLTAHLVSPRGIPIMGRSLCYRTAVPSPVIAASLLAPETMHPGLARRALDATWHYFSERGALQGGALTMGYFGNDPRLIDSYTGPGSCHWGLRSLVLAFMAQGRDPLWSAPVQPLPVEQGDYQLRYRKLGWTIIGNSKTLDIIVKPGNSAAPRHRLVPFTRRHLIVQETVERPCRPRNLEIKYELPEYSALNPLGGSLDNDAQNRESWLDSLRPPWGCGFNLGVDLG